jgi:hypothetical protein
MPAPPSSCSTPGMGPATPYFPSSNDYKKGSGVNPCFASPVPIP